VDNQQPYQITAPFMGVGYGVEFFLENHQLIYG